jgi:isoquinoline 1-oxidoreductase subunit alpha
LLIEYSGRSIGIGQASAKHRRRHGTFADAITSVQQMAILQLSVNGHSHTVNVDPDVPLLWVLRDTLHLRGTKFGCGRGMCGACTVLVDGTATRACMTPAAAVGRRPVTTIEGLGGGGLHPVQAAWVEEDVPQCGYCQAGQIMTAVSLLKANPDPSDEEIIEGMSGNLCRCGTYLRIRRAVRRAAAVDRGAR